MISRLAAEGLFLARIYMALVAKATGMSASWLSMKNTLSKCYMFSFKSLVQASKFFSKVV